MATTLPSRGSVRQGARSPRATRLPGAETVPQVNLPSDPGVRAPSGAFGGGQGQALQNAGEDIARIATAFGEAERRDEISRLQAERRLQERRNAVERATEFESANLSLAGELERFQQDPNFTNPTSAEKFGESLNSTIQKTLDSHQGDEESRLILAQRLENLRGAYADKFGRLQVAAQQQQTVDILTGRMQGLTAAVSEDPLALEGHIQTWEDEVRNMAPSLKRDQVSAQLEAGRQQLTLSAVNSLTAKDDYRAARALVAGDGIMEGMTPAQQRSITASIDAAQTRAVAAAERERRAAAADLRELRRDHLASVQTTGQGIPGFMDRAKAVMEPEDFAALAEDEALASEYHTALETVRFSPLEEVGAELAKFQPEPGTEGFAERQRMFDSLQKGVVQMLKQREKDPAGYVMGMPEIQRRFESVGDDPAAYRRALRTRLDMQEDLGIPKSLQRVLADGEINAAKEQIETADPEQVGAVMLSMQEAYGEMLPRVVSELSNAGLDPRYTVLAATAGDPRLTQNLGQVIRVGRKALKEGLEPTDITDIDRRVSEELSDWTRAIELGDPTGGRAQSVNNIVSTVQDLAILYHRQGQDVSSAVESAVDQVIMDRYIVSDTWYAPRDIAGAVVDQGRVESRMDAMLDEDAIRSFGPQALGSIMAPDLPADIREDGLISTAVNSGYWVTNETGTGAFLMVPFRGGGALPLLDDMGNRYEVDFRDASLEPALAQRKKTRAELEREVHMR